MSVPAARIRTTSGWRDIAIQGAPGIPGFTPSARGHSAAFAITADTNARFYNPPLTVDFDTIGGNCLTVTQGRFTAPVAGKYLVGFTIDQLGNGTASLAVIINAATVLKRITAAGGTGADGTKAGIEHWDIYNLNAGDNLMVHGWSSGGGSTNVLHIDAIRLDAPGVSLPSNAPQYLTPAQFALLTPVNGLEVYLVVDATNGIVWHLRYNANSSSAYKWEFLGGAPLYHDTGTDDASFTNAYVDLSGGTPGPQLTTPLAGDYIIEFGALSYQTVVNITNYLAPKIGAAATSDNDASAIAFAGTSQLGTHQRKKRFNAIAANTLVKMQGRASSANAGAARARWMTMEPVRVG